MGKLFQWMIVAAGGIGVLWVGGMFAMVAKDAIAGQPLALAVSGVILALLILLIAFVGAAANEASK